MAQSGQPALGQPLETRVAGLESALGALEERLVRLENLAAGIAESAAAPGEPLITARAAAGEVAAGEVAAEPAVAESFDFVTALSLLGRTLLAFAGAYLLRALTSAGTFPEVFGVVAGLVYAATWAVLADRSAGRGQRLSAGFHGATAVLVAVPLIWETTVRFALLSPPVAVAALALFTALCLVVAGRRRLGSLAWIVSLAAGVAALLMGPHSRAPVPFALFLVALGAATLWLARVRGWPGLPWATALLADLAVVVMAGARPIEREWASLGGVVTVDLALFFTYVACFVALERRGVRGPTLFAAFQTLAVLGLGLGGAVALLRASVTVAPMLGGALLFLAIGLYVLGLAVVDRGARRSVFYYTSLALPLTLVGSALLIERPALLWSLAAVVAAWAGGRWRRYVASLHAVLFVLAAFWVSGLLTVATRIWLWSADSWPAITAEELAAVAAALFCLGFRRRAAPVEGHWYAAVPGALLFALAVWGGGALVVAMLALGSGPLAADPGLLATLRTAVLAAAALALAAAGRMPALREAGLLVYPALFAGAIKLLVEDLPTGRPATLALAFALYGTALILAPRLLRRGRSGFESS